MTHYYFDDCAYYTPLMSDPFYGAIFFRTDLIDASTGRPVDNRYVDCDVPAAFVKSATKAASGRQPVLPAGFDPELYLAANPDVKAAHMDAVVHDLRFGHREQRKLRP